MAISVVTSVSGNVESADVSFTLPISPVEDDVIFVTVNGIVNGAVDTHPAGWVNVLGEGVLLVPSDSSICMAMLYHVVTEAEDAGDQVTWTMTEFWTVSRAVEVQVAVLRGVDLTDVVKAVGTVTNASNSTTHVLPEVASGDVPDDGDFVLRAVMADDLSTYTTPSGHTQIASSNTNAGSWLGYRNAATTASTTVAAQNIEATLSGESAGFTVIVGVAGGALEPAEGSASGAITWSGAVTGSHRPQGAVAGAIGWAGSVVGAKVPIGLAVGTVGWAGSTTGARVSAGELVGGIDWAGTVTGSRTSAAAVAGAVAWSGLVTGEAPDVGVSDGAVVGTVTWTGVVDGLRAPLAAVAGSVTWAGVVNGENGDGVGAVGQVNRRYVTALRMNGRDVVDARINGRHILIN